MAHFDRDFTRQELRDYLGEFADCFDINGIADDLRDLYDTWENFERCNERPWTIDEVDPDYLTMILQKNERED